MALNKYVEAFVRHVIFLSTMAIHPGNEAQIALLIVEKVKILTKYSNFSNVFSNEKTLILLEVTELN